MGDNIDSTQADINTLNEYLIHRFKRNNHNKYHKYCELWISNITETQVNYFRLEKERLGL